MSKRWKPKKDEVYFIIDAKCGIESFTWKNDGIDNSLYTIGNCFKTRTKAESASSKVKELLLGLHGEPATGCIQLPKLTAEVFNRPDCPKWAKYAAVDKNGSVRFHAEEPFVPTTFDGEWWCSEGNDSSITGKFDASDWKNSLIERPKKKPEWCKFGVVGWHKRAGYFTVCADDELAQRISIQQIDDKSRGWLSYETLCTEVKQAHLRPFNTKEMKALVGRTASPEYGTVFLVTKFFDNREGGEVCVDGIYYNADSLLDEFTIDDKPAGVLEHLNEKGEWVE